MPVYIYNTGTYINILYTYIYIYTHTVTSLSEQPRHAATPSDGTHTHHLASAGRLVIHWDQEDGQGGGETVVVLPGIELDTSRVCVGMEMPGEGTQGDAFKVLIRLKSNTRAYQVCVYVCMCIYIYIYIYMYIYIHV